KTIDNELREIQEYEPGSWINVVEPTSKEIAYLKETFAVEEDFIKAAMDLEEAPHIDTEEDQILIVVDIPIIEKEDGKEGALYTTIPLAIILLKKCIITVCREDETFMQEFLNNRIKGFYTQYKTRFVLQILYRNSTKYLQYLRLIDKTSDRMEHALRDSIGNKELLDFMRLEKSLVYLSSSLHANGVLLERLMRNAQITNYPEDAELLEDVIIENKQANEMAKLYSSIVTSTTETFATIISNNQNNVMKILTTVTIVMVIPQIVGGLMGMNVILPLSSNSPWSFWLIVALTVVFSLIAIWILWRKKML
ncbi:MAG: magnesium transporter CorA family protein, partial [Gallicola sp.]|nr:magnesium transporter CorA family protein [Gallicola sp.]